MKNFQMIWIIIIVILITSCGNNGSLVSEVDNTIISDKIKLRFVNSWGGSDPNSESLQWIIQKFMEENPSIEVINESVQGDDFLSKIKADFASGNDPDVFGLWPGSDIRGLINANKVADLTDLVNDDILWKKSFNEKLWGYATYNNKIYGIPLEGIYEGLFVNKSKFNMLQLDLPQTYEDLKNSIVKLREHDIIPIAFNSLSEGSFIYQNIIMKIGGKYNVENPIINGKINSCYIEGLKIMKELYNLKSFPDKYNSLSNKDRDSLFIDEKAAMIVQGSWLIGKLPNDLKQNIEFIPFPIIKGGQVNNPSYIFGFGCGTFYISNSAWNDNYKKSKSIRLLKYLTSKESSTIFTSKLGMFCNNSNFQSDIIKDEFARNCIENVNNAKELIGPPDSYVDRSLWEDIIIKNLSDFLEGKKQSNDLWDQYLKAHELKNK